MRTPLILVIVLFASAYASAQQSDRELVHAAIEDYVEALYNVQPERIQKSVHTDLTKKGFWRKDATQPYGPGQTMTYEQLHALAAKWNASRKLSPDAPKKIEIFDVQDQTASAKLTAFWGTDYFHLAKYDGKWMIVNVMWQSPPVITQN